MIDRLRNSNNQKEEHAIELEGKLAEVRKLYNHKRIEHEALQKSQADSKAYLEKQVDATNNRCERLQQDLEEEERKLMVANEVALANRKIISEQTNRITFLECDLEVKMTELHALREERERLQNEL